MRARLIPVDGGPSLELVKDMTLVGRGDECDVRLDHKSVSKLHCVLVRTDGLVLVRDLGSTNGTRVNGQRVRRAALLPADRLAIAAFRYAVRFGDDPPGGPAPAPDGTAPDAPAGGPDPAEKVDRAGPAIRRNPLPDAYPDAPPPT